MTYRIAFMIAFSCFLPLVTQASSKTKPLQETSSFHQLVGETAWQVSLKDFAVSTVKDGRFFTLRVQDDRYFTFSAHPENDSETARFGPLLPTYAPTLARLLSYAMTFGGLEKKDEVSMNVDWELYPDSIRKWAVIWKNSELREKWKNLPSHKGYPQLVAMINRQLKEDFQPLALDLGFKATGTAMEKMTFQEVGKLPFFKEILKPAGIPADLELPMPLILSLQMKPVEEVLTLQAESTIAVTVESLFATATSSSASLYCSFLRRLDEYELSGERLSANGTYTRILPLNQKEYRPFAAQLLKACLRATGGDKREAFALRLNLNLYPKVFQEVVKQFNFSPEQARKTEVHRSQLPKLQFFTFEPSQASRFASDVNPFLKTNGYEFRHLLVSVESQHNATSYPAYEDSFKPLGIHPEDRPAVPDIVYMIIGKKQE